MATPAAPVAASAPDWGDGGRVTVETADGGRVPLADLGRAVTVVAVWATFCAPCLDELPYVDALHRRHAGDDVAVFALNVDDRSDPRMRARVAEIEERLGLRLPRYYGGQAAWAELAPQDQRGAPRFALPLLAVIDRGFQIHREIGFERQQPVEAYLAHKARLIAAARRGTPPVEPSAGEPPAGGPVDGRLTLAMPRIEDAAARAAFLTELRAQLAQVFPHLAPARLDELVERAERALADGGDLEVDLGAMGSPTSTPPR